MIQQSIVAVIVAYAVWVVAKRYAPKTVQIAVRVRLARACGKLGWHGAARQFDSAAHALSGAGGCGSCGGGGNCGGPSDKTPAEKQFTITPEALKRTARR